MKLAREIGDLGATVMPERPAVGYIREAEDLLHTPVAVGRDHEHAAGQLLEGGLGDADHDVVVELPLRMASCRWRS